MFKVIFFRTEAGHEPVRDWLKELDTDARRIIGEDLRTLQLGWPLGMPLCRPLGGGLYEVRSKLSANKQIARLMFFQAGESLIVVEGFIKKTQKTPDALLKQARGRKSRYEGNAGR